MSLGKTASKESSTKGFEDLSTDTRARDSSSKKSERKSWVRWLRVAAVVLLIGLALGGLVMGSVGAQGGTEEWSFDTGDKVRSSPTVVDGTVYFGSHDNNVYALDASDGTKLWSFTTGGAVKSSPNVVDDTVYIGSTDNSVYALDASNGSERWSFETGNQVRSSPTVLDGTVYVGSRDENVYALDASSGNKEWEFEIGGQVRQSPTVANSTVYIGSLDGKLYALDSSSGDELWSFDTGQTIRSSPTVSDGVVYFGNRDGKTGGFRDNNLYAVDASTGTELWSHPSNGWVDSSPTVADGTVYVGSAPGSTGKNVYALDASTGNEKWAFSEPGWSVLSSPTVVEDTVYFGSREDVPFSSKDGSLYAVDTDTGNKRWEFTKPSSRVQSSPTVSDGVVYVGSSDGNLYAIDAGESGSSEGSRVELGTLGHDNVWNEKQETGEIIFEEKFNYSSVGSSPWECYNRPYNYRNVRYDRTPTKGFCSIGGSTAKVQEESARMRYLSRNVSLPDTEGNLTIEARFRGRISASYSHSKLSVVRDQSVMYPHVDDRSDKVTMEVITSSGGYSGGTTVTDWKTITVNITEYAGEEVRLTMSANGRWVFDRIETTSWVETDYIRIKETGKKSEDKKSELSGTVIEEGSRRAVAGALVEIESVTDGKKVAEAYTDRTGRWSTEIKEDDYTVTASYSGESEKKTVRHDGEATVLIQMNVSSCNGRDFVVKPEEPVTYEEVTLQGCDAGGSSVEWEIDGNKIATGSVAVHSFDSPGTYMIRAEIDGRRSTRAIEVNEAEFAIEDVNITDGLEGPTIEGLPVENTYKIEVESSPGIDTDEVSLGLSGETVAARETGDGKWKADVDLSDLGEDTDVVITAESTEDLEATDTSTIVVNPAPEWLEYLRVADVVTQSSTNVIGVNDWQGDEVTGEVGFVVLDLNWEKTPSVLEPFFDKAAEAKAEAGTALGLTLPEGVPKFQMSGEGKIKVADQLGIDGSLEGGAEFNPNDLSVDKSYIDAEVGVEREIFSQEVGLEDVADIELVIEADGKVSKGVSFDGGPRPRNFDHGTFSPGIGVGGEAETGTQGIEGRVSAEGDVEGTGLYEIKNPPVREAQIGFNVSAEAEFTAVFFTKSGEATLLNHTLSWMYDEDSPSRLSLASTPASNFVTQTSDGSMNIDFGSEWEVQSKRGNNLPENFIIADQDERLSNRQLRDTQPAVAAPGGKRVVIWSSQDEDKDVVKGRDLVYRTQNTDSGDWSSAEFVTDDRFHDERPAFDSGGEGMALAVWTRLTEDLSREEFSPKEAFNMTEVAFSAYDAEDDEWSNLKTVENSGGFITSQAVDGNSDGWLVAWGSNDGGVGGYDERTVGFGYVDTQMNMTVRGELDDATHPDVSVRDDGTLELAYYKPVDGMKTGEIVMGEVSENGFRETVRYDTDNFEGLSLSQGRLVWVDGDTEEGQKIHYTEGNIRATNEPNANISSIDEVNFEYEDGIGVLTYRGRPETQNRRDIVYRVLNGDDWLTDRRIAGGKDMNLTLWHSDVAVGQDGFSLAYSAKRFGSDQVGDIFVAEHEYLPEFTVEADASESGAELGDTVTVDYTVRNIGDVDADETVPVVIKSDGERLDTDGVGPLQVDETASGSFDVPVTPTGRYTVSVDPNDEVETIFEFGEEDNWAPRSEEVVVAEPNVYVEDTETERLSKSVVRVNVSLVNSGGVPLRNMKMSVSDGEDFVANTTVGSVGAKSSEEVSVRVDPERLDSPLMDSVVLDPDSEIDDSAFRFREKSTVLLMPDIAVREPVRYWRDDNESDKRVVASALIENRGVATANAEVVLENVKTGERVGRKSVTIRPAVDGVPVFKRVGVALDGDVERGDTLRVSASTERHDPDVTDTATVGTVFITDGIPDGLLGRSSQSVEESEGCLERRNMGRGDKERGCPDDRDLSRGGTNREDTREQDRRSRGRGDSADRDGRRGGRDGNGR